VKEAMNQFINSRETTVNEALDGYLRLAEGRLARLDGYPHIRVVVRTDLDPDRVALVSGGGSGHEPAHAGYVGAGMLSAAVCGDVFASPSVDAVLAGILAVTGRAGCLLIVKNYTGDRLNFGLAAERARAFGLRVAMVVVADDIALPHAPQPRGVAGTLFVHKVAGALAERGASLDEVAAAAERVARGVVSLGMSLDTCTVPGNPKEHRIGTGMAELGLGIHGEAGVEQISFTGARQAIELVTSRLGSHVGDGPLAALINDLGGATGLEMAILTEEFARTQLAARTKLVIGPAALMTSLDMRGFSISLLPLTADLEEALVAPVANTTWPAARPLGAVRTIALHDGMLPIPPIPSPHEGHRRLLLHCCERLVRAEAALNALDARAGDGDTGSTLATAATALMGAVDRLPLADLTQFYRAIGLELSQTMGGSSGVLLAIFFTAAGDASANGSDAVGALAAGLERVMEVGGAGLGDRTMIDALAPAIAALPHGIPAAAAAARGGADRTASITRAKAGRSSYLSPDKLAGSNDPGAEAVALLFEALTASEWEAEDSG
jgi:ATP-dependent dihydroxyacetone kinase